jgi:hypothetical protein
MRVVRRHKMDKQERWWWYAPEYFSRWRLFPRAFISMYIYLLYDVVQWFMALETPNMEQAGLVSVIVGAGAAWFGLYVNSSSTKFETVEVPPEDVKMTQVQWEAMNNRGAGENG